jgi:thioredoxin-related protein
MAINNPTPTKKSSLDTAANIAIIVVCALAAVVLVRQHFFPPQAQGPAAMEEAVKGEKYAELKAVVPAGTSRALVVAVQPGCHYCNDSMPFYKRLIDERNQKGSAVKVIAAVPASEKPEDAKKFASDESQKFATAGTQPDSMVNIDFQAIKVPGTPTVLLVDNNGKVLDVWVGKLNSSREKEVLKTL